MGNFHNWAIFKHSKNCPLLQVPSPKNAAVTASLLLLPTTSFLYLLAKAAPKAKPAQAKPATSKSSGTGSFYQSSSGTRGQNRKVGDPGPAVRRRGSVRDGESIDPRERSLRRNQNEARRHSRRNLRLNRRGRRI